MEEEALRSTRLLPVLGELIVGCGCSMIFESNRSSMPVSWWSSTQAPSILGGVSANSSKSSASTGRLGEPWSGPYVQDGPSRAAAARDIGGATPHEAPLRVMQVGAEVLRGNHADVRSVVSALFSQRR